MPARVIGEVVYSNSEQFASGDLVSGEWGWTHYAVVFQEKVQKMPKNIPNPENFLGLYGISGLTAYFGLFNVGKVKKG